MPDCLADRAAECCEASLHGDQLPASVAIARAALSLLSCVRFSSGESAAPYSTVAIRCKQALLAAYNAGASVVEEVSTAALPQQNSTSFDLLGSWLVAKHKPACLASCEARVVCQAPMQPFLKNLPAPLNDP